MPKLQEVVDWTYPDWLSLQLIKSSHHVIMHREIQKSEFLCLPSIDYFSNSIRSASRLSVCGFTRVGVLRKYSSMQVEAWLAIPLLILANVLSRRQDFARIRKAFRLYTHLLGLELGLGLICRF